MTNQEKTDKLFRGAKWAFQDMERALEQGEWNIAIRRAQEVVETSLKGVLTLMGVDYPKEHDPSEVFARVVRERGLEVPHKTLTEIRALSATLAQKRAPAFYGEIDIIEEEARPAAEGAAKVLQLGLDLKARLLTGTEEKFLTQRQKKE